MNTTNPDFDRWFFQWRCEHDAGPVVNLWPLKEAYEAGYAQAQAAPTVKDWREIKAVGAQWVARLCCGYRAGTSHHCKLTLGHSTPHLMVQTDSAGSSGATTLALNAWTDVPLRPAK